VIHGGEFFVGALISVLIDLADQHVPGELRLTASEIDARRLSAVLWS